MKKLTRCAGRPTLVGAVRRRLLPLLQFLPLLSLLLLLGCARAETRSASRVELGAELGKLDLLVGTNAGPRALPPRPGHEPARRASDGDYSALYKELGFTAVRTHDFYGPADWYTIFPNWNADPTDPASYDFSSTDETIRAIHEGGFEILFRIGPSWSDPRKEFPGDPPGTQRAPGGRVLREAGRRDFEKFAEVAVHIVKHYNEGWADGFHMGIRRWEIWNEPSLSQRFWLGTPRQFHEMFAIVSRTLKTHDPLLRVGGPGHAGGQGDRFVGELVEYLQREKAPLDFLSWHFYGLHGTPSDILAFGQMARDYRKILDRHGFTRTDLICDEWGAGMQRDPWGEGLRGASAYAAILSLLAWNGVQESYQYRGDDHPAGLVRDGGASLSPVAGGLRLWKRFAEGAPTRIDAKARDLDDVVLAVVRARDGELRLLASNLSTGARSLALPLAGMTSATRVDLDPRGELVESEVRVRKGEAILDIPGQRALLLIARPSR